MVAVGFVLIRLDQVGDAGDSSTSVPGRAVSIASIVGVIAGALFGAALLRRLVQLPTGGSSSDLLAIRHALRTASVLTVVGAMFVIFGFVGVRLGQAAFVNDGSRSELLRWTSNLATFISANLGRRRSLTVVESTPPHDGSSNICLSVRRVEHWRHMTAISIDVNAKTPPFEQIKGAIVDAISRGELPAGHRLPIHSSTLG